MQSEALLSSYFMGCIWFGVCWRSIAVWLWRCGVFIQSEALLTCSCGMRGLGVNSRLEQRVGFA